MKVVDIIRATKTNVQVTNWENGTIPPKKYPLARRGRSLGRGWRWRLVDFTALDQKFTLLVALSEEKEAYRCALSWHAKDGFRVLCHHELHTSHYGWHCHFFNGDVNKIEPRKSRDQDTFKRWPSFSSDECHEAFIINYQNALEYASIRFRFKNPEMPTLI